MRLGGIYSRAVPLASDPRHEKNVIAGALKIAGDLLGKFVSRLEEAGTEPSLLDSRRSF